MYMTGLEVIKGRGDATCGRTPGLAGGHSVSLCSAWSMVVPRGDGWFSDGVERVKVIFAEVAHFEFVKESRTEIGEASPWVCAVPG